MYDPPGPFQLGEHRVDPATNRVLASGGEVRLEPKVMAVLVALAERAGTVVTREALIDLVWGVQFGGDESLTRAISILRRLLGDDRERAAFIETIPKRGYRLVAAPTIAPLVSRGGSLLRAREGGPPLATVAAGLTGESGLGGEPVSLWRRSAAIAVLPFDNQSTEPANGFLADGLADEIRSSLARNASLAVIAGSSSFRFRGAAKDLAAVTEALGVSHVVDGAVRGDTDSVRVAVYLIDAVTGVILWSAVEERPRGQIFGVHDEISQAIQAALGLAPVDASRKPRRLAPSPAAYETYLHSLALLRDGTPVNCERAIEFLSGLVASDPTFADAWASLALARLQLVFLLWYDPAGQIEAARAAARRALELDPRSLEARLALAVVDYRDDTVPIAETERRFAELLDEEPNNPDLNFRMALLLVEVGRIAEGAARHARAYQLDPLSAPVVAQYAWCLLRIWETSRAEAVIDETIRRWGAGDWGLWYLKFELFMRRGEFAAARAWIDETNRISSHPTDAANLLAVQKQLVAFAAATDPAMAEREKRELLAAVGRSAAQYPAVVRTLIGVGDHDTAFEIARQQIAAGSRWFRGSALMHGPATASFLAEPRVMELFAANGLAAYWLETDRWPDFSAQPELPYDCRALARTLVEGIRSSPK